MSDLRYLFTRNNKEHPSLPSKRLFNTDEPVRSRERGVVPQKYSPNRSKDQEKQWAGQKLSKKYLPQSLLRKEIGLYNNQILLVFIRKIFFFMVAVALLNMLITDTYQNLVLSTLCLSLSFLDLTLSTSVLTQITPSLGIYS